MTEHGTRACYLQGCRQPPCATANTSYLHNLRQRRKQDLAADPTLKPHGSPSTYVNWGCRCPQCGNAHSIWLKDHRKGPQ